MANGTIHKSAGRGFPAPFPDDVIPNNSQVLRKSVRGFRHWPFGSFQGRSPSGT